MGEHAAFFYGTLMFPGILHRVIYGTPDPEPWQKALTNIRPALLQDFQRHKVMGVHYPAVIPCKGASVRGSVCTGLTDGDLWRLDIFEGDQYYKAKVKAKILQDSVGIADKVDESRLNELMVEEMEVNIYLWREDLKDMLEETEWDFDEFKDNKMKMWTGEGLSSDEDDIDEGFDDVVRAVEIEKSSSEKEKAAQQARV